MNDKKLKLRKHLHLQKHQKNKNKFNIRYAELKKKLQKVEWREGSNQMGKKSHV